MNLAYASHGRARAPRAPPSSPSTRTATRPASRKCAGPPSSPPTPRAPYPRPCSYAYTLSGHEYSANDDFEKAMACYRSAIRIDERHYNAWYGLGNIYYRQEK